MLLEHLIYSAALAIIVGMVYMHYTGRDPSWLVIVMTIAPDTDFIISRIMTACNFCYPVIINHGDFHNLISMLFFSLIAALILSRYTKMNFTDVLLCSMIGFAAHFIEDFLVYASWYSFWYPWSLREYGIAIIPETKDLFGLADTHVLVVGLLLLALVVGVRMYFDVKWTIRSHIMSYFDVGLRMKYYAEVLLSGNSEKLE
jgi:membrane-bound metal-dependent hydrolase YbcI (DUF457 family)